MNRARPGTPAPYPGPFRLAALDARRHPAVTLAVLLALALAVAASGMLFRLARLAGAREAGLVRAGDALIGAKAGTLEILLGCLKAEGPAPGFIPYRLYVSLANHARLTAAEGTPDPPFHRTLVPILYCGRFRGGPILGTTRDLLDLRGEGFVPSLARGAWAEAAGSAVLGARAAREAHVGVGDTVFASPWSRGPGPAEWVLPYPLRVAGVLGPMGNLWDRAAFTNLGEARRLGSRSGLFAGSPWGDDVLHYMVVETRPGRLEALRALIDGRTVAQLAEVRAGLETLRSLTGSARGLSAAVSALAVALAGLCVLGVSLGSLDERARVFAALRALGFPMRDLLAVALWQGFLPALGACALGAILDGACFPALRRALGDALPSAADAPSALWQSAPVWAAFAGLSLCAAWLPFERFRRLPERKAIQLLS